MSSVTLGLTTPDYVVFGVCLGVSAAIGIFYAIRGEKNEEDYQLGGRQLHMLPVAFSLSVSFMSAITVLGTPGEVYVYGTMYWWFLGSLLFVAIITGEIFLPMFYRMGVASTYEYLEKRFNRVVRYLGTIIYIFQTVFYQGIVIYAPSLALNKVTGLNLWMSVLLTGFVCIFYTAVGGIKAVIWTDVFQAFVMVAGFVALAVKGSSDVGGYSEVWKICEENGRIDFARFDLDPRYRHTVWSILVGGTFLWLSVYAVNQSQVQRYLCCKTEKQAKGALYLNWLGLVVIISLCMINGTIMYAYWSKCDPLTSGQVEKSDQLLPFFSLNLFKDYPGVTGLVISSVFSGSLSTVSSGINAMSCVTMEDFIKPNTKWSAKTYNYISKGLVVVFGVLSIAMAYLASQLGAVLEAALSIFGLLGGPLLGLFTLGFLFPFVNSLGAAVGLLCGIVVPTWIYVGSKTYKPLPQFIRKLDFDTSGCNFTFDATVSSPVGTSSYPPIASFYSVSYIYYSCYGFATVLVIGIVLSLLTNGWKNRNEVDPKYLYSILDHWIFGWLPEKAKSWSRCGVDRTVEEEDATIYKNNYQDNSVHNMEMNDEKDAHGGTTELPKAPEARSRL